MPADMPRASAGPIFLVITPNPLYLAFTPVNATRKKNKANIAATIMEKITMKISVSRKLGLFIADYDGGKRRAVIAGPRG